MHVARPRPFTGPPHAAAAAVPTHRAGSCRGAGWGRGCCARAWRPCSSSWGSSTDPWVCSCMWRAAREGARPSWTRRRCGPWRPPRPRRMGTAGLPAAQLCTSTGTGGAAPGHRRGQRVQQRVDSRGPRQRRRLPRLGYRAAASRARGLGAAQRRRLPRGEGRGSKGQEARAAARSSIGKAMWLAEGRVGSKGTAERDQATAEERVEGRWHRDVGRVQGRRGRRRMAGRKVKGRYRERAAVAMAMAVPQRGRPGGGEAVVGRHCSCWCR